MTKSTLTALFVVSAMLASCTQREVILPGKRDSLWSAVSYAAPQDTAPSDVKVVPFSAPRAVRNSAWPQAAGTLMTRTTHAVLSAQPSVAWAADIGAGDDKRKRIVADPIFAQNRVFAMDADMQVSAVSDQGAILWQRNLTPASETLGDVIGGGLAYGQGRIYVTTGYGELHALDPETGAVIWTQQLLGAGNTAPTYHAGLVYLVSNDATAWAIEADTGRVRWQIDGQSDVNNLSGALAPSVTDKFALFSYGSGEIQAAFRKGGLVYWTTVLSGGRNGRAVGVVDDIATPPLIAGSRVYVANGSGATAAIDVNNGDRIWTTAQGATGPMWAAGNSVFFVNDLNQLVRLNTSDGSVIWTYQLAGFTQEKPTKSAQTYAHHGPILAGGQLVLASNDGKIRFFDPMSGQLQNSVDIPQGATTQPIVANATLYLVSTDGKLYAFR
jgi:outer membrane protein assembly factor BamB